MKLDDLRIKGRPVGWLVEGVAVLAAFTAMTVAITWPLAAHVSTHTADIGVDDPLLYARLLRHFLAWLSGSHGNLFDADYFWPQPNVLATTDASLGILYCALPFLIFTRDLLTLVNIGVLVTFVLTGHATYLLARELTQSRSAALFAGAAFSFCLFRLHQLDHLNILQMQWMSYALFGLLRLYNKPSRVAVAGTALALFLHGSAGTNVALYSAFLFAGVAIWLVGSKRGEERKRFVTHAAVAIGVAVIALIPIYLPYLQMRAAHTLEWPEWHVDVYGGRAEQLFAAPPYNRVHGPSMAKNLFRESYLFLGWSVLILGALGVFLSRVRLADVPGSTQPKQTIWALAAADVVVAALAIPWALKDRWIAVALIAFVLGRELVRVFRKKPFDPTASLGLLFAGLALFYLFAGQGPHIQSHGQTIGEGLWRWLAKIPGFGAVRTPARFFFVVSLAAALVAALGLRELQQRIKSKTAGHVLAIAALAVVLWEMNVSPLPLRGMQRIETAHPAYKWIAAQPGKAAVLELPFFDPFERYRMYHTTVFDRPTVAGEAGWRPPLANWLLHDAFVNGSALEKLKLFRGSGVEFVLLDNRLINGPVRARYEEFVAASGATRVTEIAGMQIWRYPPISPKPLSPEHAKATVLLPNRLITGQPLNTTVRFETSGADPVFEYTTRKLTLRLRAANDSASSKLYLSPPLIVPDVKIDVQTEVKLSLPDGAHEVKYELVDDRGATWTTGTATVDAKAVWPHP